nr:hypothetical protein [Mycobacterium sp.]
MSVIDPSNDTVIHSITGSTSDDAAGLAVSPETGDVYVADDNGNSVSVIDSATDKVIRTITVSSQPFGVAVAPGGVSDAGDVFVTTVSVTNAANGTASVITIPGFHEPAGLAVDPGGPAAGDVFVANQGSDSVSVIAPTDLDKVSYTISEDSSGGFDSPLGVAVTPAGDTGAVEVYVTNYGNGTVSVLNLPPPS